MKDRTYNDAHNEIKRSRVWIVLVAILLVAAVALSVAARMVQGFAEWYSTHVYPVLQGTYGRLTGLIPFSLAELICLAIPVFLIVDVIIHRHRLRIAMKHLLVIVSVLIFLYSANCGVNYYREPFVPYDTYASAEEKLSPKLLVSFCEYTADKLNESPSSADYPIGDDLAAASRSAMQSLGSEYSALSGFYPIPKELTVLSRFFSQMNVSGVYSPFTIEANINGEMPAFNKPFTSCHELSHLRGFMNEGEANYIGWLACIESDDVSFNRSGWLYAWIYAGRTLRRVDPDTYLELKNKLPDDVIRELEENDEFWISHKTKASDVQDQVNDAYLKVNGQEQGIASYGQLTTLMLIWYLEHPEASGQ